MSHSGWDAENHIVRQIVAVHLKSRWHELVRSSFHMPHGDVIHFNGGKDAISWAHYPCYFSLFCSSPRKVGVKHTREQPHSRILVCVKQCPPQNIESVTNHVLLHAIGDTNQRDRMPPPFHKKKVETTTDNLVRVWTTAKQAPKLVASAGTFPANSGSSTMGAFCILFH